MGPHKITMLRKVRKQRSKLRGLDFRCHDVSARRWPPHPESRDRVSTYSSSDHTSAHSISLFYISHISLRTSLTLLSISFSFILLLLLYHSHNSYYFHALSISSFLGSVLPFQVPFPLLHYHSFVLPPLSTPFLYSNCHSFFLTFRETHCSFLPITGVLPHLSFPPCFSYFPHPSFLSRVFSFIPWPTLPSLGRMNCPGWRLCTRRPTRTVYIPWPQAQRRRTSIFLTITPIVTKAMTSAPAVLHQSGLGSPANSSAYPPAWSIPPL